MTAELKYTLFCDDASCERTFEGSPGEALPHVRLRAFGMDWNHDRRQRKDYCPQHDPKRLAVLLAETRS